MFFSYSYYQNDYYDGRHETANITLHRKLYSGISTHLRARSVAKFYENSKWQK